MTEPRTFTSPAGRADRRAEFVDFYQSTYPAVTGELVALTGDVDVAHAVAGASYTRAWQAWPAVRNLDQPTMWVRVDAVRRTRRPPRGDGILQHGRPALPEVALDPEDEVLVAALQRLPVKDRLPLVLHYLSRIPVERIAGWFGEQDDEVEARLDSGFDALVGILDWPDGEGGSAGQGDAYEWTAEVLEDCGQRFRETIPVPPPTLVFRRGTVTNVTRRGAPITAAAVAVVGLIAYLSPTSERTAQAVTYAAPPPLIAAGAPAELATPTPEHTAPATASPASPAGTVTRSEARRVTTTKPAAGNAVAAVPAIAVSSSPVVTTSTTPTSTTPTSTTPTSTTPTTTAAATGGGSGSDELAASGSTGSDSTGSSVVTTTGSTTPDTTTGETTDETDTDETTTSETSTTTTHQDPDQDDCLPVTTTRYRHRDRDDCPSTTTSTTQTSTTETETETTDPSDVVTTLTTTITATGSSSE